MSRTWEKHSFAIEARKCHEVQLSVPAAHTLRWQFCVEGIAVDIGLCVQVLQQPSVDEAICTPNSLTNLCEQSKDRAEEQTCRQTSVDEDKESTGGTAAAERGHRCVADVPWHGLKVKRPKAAVLRRLTGMTGDYAGVPSNAVSIAGSSCGGDAISASTNDGTVDSVLPPEGKLKQGTAAEASDSSSALLGLCASDWRHAEEFCTMGLDRFGSGHVISGAWHCSATRRANATLILVFNNLHSRLRQKRVKLYTCQLLTEDALLHMEEESRLRVSHCVVAGGAGAEAGADEPTRSQQCIFKGELKVEVIRARNLGQLDQTGSARSHRASHGFAGARQDLSLDVTAGDGISLGLFQSIGTAVSSAIGNSVDAVVDHARSLSSTGVSDRTNDAAKPAKVVMDWRGTAASISSAAESDNKRLSVVPPGATPVKAEVGGFDRDAEDQSSAANGGQAGGTLAASRSSVEGNDIVPSAPYVCAYSVPSGTVSCPSRTGICRGANTKPCWRGLVACNELTLHVAENDTAIRVQLWESHRMYFDELLGEVEISLQMSEDDDDACDPKMFRLACATWYKLGGKIGGDLMLAFHRVLPPDVEKIMVESLTCNKCGKIIRQAAGGESLMVAVEAHLALCAVTRKAEHDVDALEQDNSKTTTRSLRIIVHRAVLQDVQIFGVQSPYVAVASLPSRGSKAATLSVEGGGTKPRWDGGDKNCMVLDICETDSAVIVEVLNSGVMMDDAIGAVEFDLTNLVSPFNDDLTKDIDQDRKIYTGTRVWLDLVPEGHLQCTIDWVVDFDGTDYNSNGHHMIAESPLLATSATTARFQRLPELVTPLVIAQDGTKHSYRSRVLSSSLASNLEEELPIQYRGYDWHLLYSMTLHG